MSEETLIGDAPTQAAAEPSPSATPAATAATDAAQPQQTPPAEAANNTPAETEEAASKPAERAAPEKYEFKLPEGADPKAVAEFEAMARELKMPQEEAQLLMDKLAPTMEARYAQRTAEAVAKASADWTAASQADKEFGGDKLTESLALGEKALAAFGTPELRQMLVDSKLGNHPEVIRFMVRAGKALSEDTFVAGGKPVAAKDAASVLYPNQH